VPPGRYVVNVAGISFPGWYFRGARYQGRDITDTPIDLTTDLNGVCFRSPTGLRRSRGVIRSAGAADGGGLALAFPVDADAWTTSGANARRFKVARADKGGHYAFPNLPAGGLLRSRGQRRHRDDWWDPALLRMLSRVAASCGSPTASSGRQDLDTLEVK
jgi:hypothetical protein